MTDTADLERSYRRWLRCYPKAFRREHESELLGVLMAGAREGQRRPELVERLDLVGSALRMRLRPRLPRSDRRVFAAVRVLYLGAVVELATAITLVATIDDVKASVVSREPDLTDVEWQAVLADQLWPKAVTAGVAVGFWLWTAWAVGRGHRRARIAFAIFFGLTTASLLDGLAHGSAVYARADLIVGIGLWLVELAAVTLLFGGKLAVHRSGG
jgi:hypothetical protein